MRLKVLYRCTYFYIGVLGNGQGNETSENECNDKTRMLRRMCGVTVERIINECSRR